jgi:hypothetical protein
MVTLMIVTVVTAAHLVCARKPMKAYRNGWLIGQTTDLKAQVPEKLLKKYYEITLVYSEFNTNRSDF